MGAKLAFPHPKIVPEWHMFWRDFLDNPLLRYSTDTFSRTIAHVPALSNIPGGDTPLSVSQTHYYSKIKDTQFSIPLSGPY